MDSDMGDEDYAEVEQLCHQSGSPALRGPSSYLATSSGRRNGISPFT
jgi:hypothetical protein